MNTIIIFFFFAGSWLYNIFIMIEYIYIEY